MAKAIECYEHNKTHWTFHKQGDPLSMEDFEEISEYIDWYLLLPVQGYNYCEDKNILEVWLYE
jgi:hypothetical protein